MYDYTINIGLLGADDLNTVKIEISNLIDK